MGAGPAWHECLPRRQPGRVPGQEAGTSVNRSSVPATTSGLGERRRLPARFPADVGSDNGPLCPAWAGCQGARPWPQPPCGPEGRKIQETRKQGLSPRQSQPRRWGHRAGVPALQGHTVHECQRPGISLQCQPPGHVARGCPPCSRGLDSPAAQTHPRRVGRAGTPSLSPLTAPLTSPS